MLKNKFKSPFPRLGNIIAHIRYRLIVRNILVFLGQIMHWLLFKILLPKRLRNLTKHDIFEIIFKSDTPRGKRFDISLLILIGIDLVAITIDSFPDKARWFTITLDVVQWLITIVFTMEYYLRVYCLKKPWKYIFSFYGIIDFISIFPAYLSIFYPATQTITVLRILRALRIFRILHMQRFIHEGRRMLYSLRKSMYKILIFMFFVFITAVILGSMMFMFENGKNPAFSSIPQGIYWAVVTITTVGYGDITPVTSMGRFVSIMVMLLGYSIIAVPSGIVVGETLREYQHQSNRDRQNDDAAPRNTPHTHTTEPFHPQYDAKSSLSAPPLTQTTPPPQSAQPICQPDTENQFPEQS